MGKSNIITFYLPALSTSIVVFTACEKKNTDKVWTPITATIIALNTTLLC